MRKTYLLSLFAYIYSLTVLAYNTRPRYGPKYISLTYLSQDTFYGYPSSPYLYLICLLSIRSLSTSTLSTAAMVPSGYTRNIRR